MSGGYRERGIKDASGFMAEYIVDDERTLLAVPRSLADVAVLVEPLTVAAKAAIELEAVVRRYPWEQTSSRGLVLGAGPIGLLGAMTMVSRGIDTVVYSREPRDSGRARIVEAIGARYVSAEDSPLSGLAAEVGTFDVVFEAVGVAKVAFEAMAALGPNGMFIFSGVPGGHKPVEMDLSSVMRDVVLKNQVLVGVVNASSYAFETAIRQLEQFMVLFPDAVRSLITERRPLREAPEVLRQSAGIKQVISLAA
jgi:threonine dehydrogenase-like Zn-dependent dehydrogenase